MATARSATSRRLPVHPADMQLDTRAHAAGPPGAGIMRRASTTLPGLEQPRHTAKLRERLDSLTPREREVLALVISGRRNKQIAAQAKLSEMTVKVHRSQIMRKMQAKSLVDLVRMADALGVSTRKP